MRNLELKKLSMGKWKLVEFEKIIIGRPFRFQQQNCVRCGPFTYIDSETRFRPTRDLPQELKTFVAAKIEDIHGY